MLRDQGSLRKEKSCVAGLSTNLIMQIEDSAISPQVIWIWALATANTLVETCQRHVSMGDVCQELFKTV